jgi:hypothetical protein
MVLPNRNGRRKGIDRAICNVQLVPHLIAVNALDSAGEVQNDASANGGIHDRAGEAGE